MKSRRLITGLSRLRQGVLAVQSSTSSAPGGCPLWVKSRHMHRKTACPLYPQKRHQVRNMECPLAKSGHDRSCTSREQTFAGVIGMSADGAMRGIKLVIQSLDGPRSGNKPVIQFGREGSGQLKKSCRIL